MPARYQTKPDESRAMRPHPGAGQASLRAAGLTIGGVHRDHNGDVIRMSLSRRIRRFATEGAYDADEAWYAPTYSDKDGVPSPYRKSGHPGCGELIPLVEYLEMRGLPIVNLSDDWCTSALAATLGFAPQTLWPSKFSAAPTCPDLADARATAAGLRIAIDALPVGKDIRGRLGAHVDALITQLAETSAEQ